MFLLFIHKIRWNNQKWGTKLLDKLGLPISAFLDPKSELPKLIIWHNIGSISAAESRLLLLGQCHCLHRSSAGPKTAAFFDYLNWPISSRNLAQYRPCTKPIVTFTMASSSESRRARVRPMDRKLLGFGQFLPMLGQY